MQAEFEKLANLASELPDADLPRFLGELRTLELTALSRMWTSQPAAPVSDVLVDVPEAARRLGQSEEWVYRHQQHLGARRNGRSIRFSSQRLDQYIRGKAGR